MTEEQPIRILYRNHRGETAWRIILPQRFWWGASPWHPTPQRLLDARDVEKNAPRTFAVADVLEWDFGDGLARQEADRLREAIRQHRDERGDNRCYLDDERLYAVLPEGYTARLMDTAVELDNCKRFIESRRNPATTYISPQTRIEALESALEGIVSLTRLVNEEECGIGLHVVQMLGDVAKKALGAR